MLCLIAYTTYALNRYSLPVFINGQMVQMVHGTDVLGIVVMIVKINVLLSLMPREFGLQFLRKN